jgi:hypothetical protein
MVTGPRCPACGLRMIGDLCIGCSKEPALCAPPCPVKAADAMTAADPVADALGVGGSSEIRDTPDARVSGNAPALTSERDTRDTVPK